MGDKIKVWELDQSFQEYIKSSQKGMEVPAAASQHIQTETLDEVAKSLDGDMATFFNRIRGCISGAPLARFGDIGHVLPICYQRDADNIRNMAVRPDDVWVVTVPRSGTTWTQELVWLLKNDLDYDTASKIPLFERYLYPEVIHTLTPVTDLTKFKLMLPVLAKFMLPYEKIANAPSPRFFKSHLPLSLLPARLLDTAKVVYVARDPRDVVVSDYHHIKDLRGYGGDFKSFWDLFIKDLTLRAPFFPHLKEAWAQRHHPNMLFIFYEELKRDLPSCIKRLASFFGKQVTDKQTAKLCEHLDIKNFRKNDSVNPSWLNDVANPKAEGFIRKGKAGGWRDVFNEEMTAQAQLWMRENLVGSDLRFPDAS